MAGFRRIVPQTGTGPATESGFAHGNGDLLLRMSADLEAFGASTLVVCSADHVFNMDLATGHRRPRRRRSGGHGAHDRGHQEGRLRQRRRDRRRRRHDHGDRAQAVASVQRDRRHRGVHLRHRRPARPRCASCEPSWPATRRVTTAVWATSVSTSSRAWSSTGKAVAVPMTGYWRDVGQPGLYLQSHRDLLAGRVDVFDHPARPIISHWPDRPAARVSGAASSSPTRCSRPGCDVSGDVSAACSGPGSSWRRAPSSATASSWRTASCGPVPTCDRGPRRAVRGAARGPGRGGEPDGRVARDEDVVLVGRDCRVGGEIAAGARLEPGHRPPLEAASGTARYSSEPWWHVGRRRLHPAQAQVAAGVHREPGRDARRRSPTRWRR